MKFRLFFAIAFLLGVFVNAQEKYERGYRIKKSQFPTEALQYIEAKLKDVKRIKFYKETDGDEASFETKFKKDRLWYSIEFDEKGKLEDIEILIKSIDLPEETFTQINNYLDENFTKYRIRKMYQQYLVNPEESIEETLKNAFQNLMLPTINYKLIISGKKDSIYEQFEVLFDAGGNFTSIRKSPPPNYDHILY